MLKKYQVLKEEPESMSTKAKNKMVPLIMGESLVCDAGFKAV